jgi:hypothetical protein
MGSCDRWEDETEQGTISPHQGIGFPCSAPEAGFSNVFFVSLSRNGPDFPYYSEAN